MSPDALSPTGETGPFFAITVEVEIRTVSVELIEDTSSQTFLEYVAELEIQARPIIPLAGAGPAVGAVVFILSAPQTVNPHEDCGTVCLNKMYQRRNIRLKPIYDTTTEEGPPDERRPGLFRGGNSMLPRPKEYKKDENGLVQTTHGVSTNVDPNKVMQFGGAYRVGPLPPR